MIWIWPIFNGHQSNNIKLPLNTAQPGPVGWNVKNTQLTTIFVVVEVAKQDILFTWEYILRIKHFFGIWQFVFQFTVWKNMYAHRSTAEALLTV